MSAPVNVLAVLTHHANGLRLGPKLTRAQFERVADDLERVHAAVAEMIEALAGLVSIEDSVTQGQERDRREEWIPKARAVLARVGGAS
jgi:hypothetical protein